MQNLKSQQGLSLIELMIAITLGIVLMGAALQFMLSTRQTYDLNDDISRIQENGRMALDIIVKDLQMAGYRHPLNVLNGGKPSFFLDCVNAEGATTPCAADGGTNTSDTLSIQFDPPPDNGTIETDCTGASVPTSDIIANIYTVRVVDGISSLYCQSYNASTNTDISAAVPLVDGIDNMQVLYRVTTKIGNSERYRFVAYDQLDADDLPNITAARVGLLVSNGFATGSADSQAREYRVLDSGTIQYTDDRQPRRIYSTTVQFNNRM
ncbi:MAG: PilW family protein [Spongiibacteraceae bacterium]